jgi:acyl-coenzyme A thioesterase PaaI-like protein
VSAKGELVHHELCFGCGRTNLFGLLLEVRRTSPRTVAGRCFIKQDHQGPDRSSAHEGVIAAALSDAMALACGPGARAAALEVRLLARAPVGTFLEIEARVEEDRDGGCRAAAKARAEGRPVAESTGTYSAV